MRVAFFRICEHHFTLGLINYDRILLLLLFKKVSSARLGESDIHPISPKTPAPQYQPIKVKGKVFYGQEPPSGESTTTECGVNYQLLAVMY